MTWLAPWVVGAGVLAAIGVALLHLLARDRPPRWLLPTARFVPAGSARATRRASTPRDRALLALRMLALLLAAAGFAGPVRTPSGAVTARLVVLEHSPALADIRAAVDSARTRLRSGDELVVLGAAAVAIPAPRHAAVLDSLASATPHPDASAGIGAALVAALRTAPRAAQRADSLALVIIASHSTLVGDAATATMRAEWPGRIDVVGIEARDAPDSLARFVRGTPDDPVVAAMRLLGARAAQGGVSERGVLLARSATAADSAWARAGGTLVVWSDSAHASDTTSALIVHAAAGSVVAPFAAPRGATPAPGRVVARHADGTPAAGETTVGAGCIRTVAVPVPVTGDVTLRPAFQRALAALTAPCRAFRDGSPSEALTRGPTHLVPARTLRGDAARSPATPWLLGAAVALLLIEPLVRRPATSAARAPA